MDSFLLFSWETWILILALVVLLVVYGYKDYGVFERLGIPCPKPRIYLGTVGRYSDVYYLDDMANSRVFGRVWGMYELKKPVLVVMEPDMLKTILVKECFTYFTNRRNLRLNGELYDSLSFAEDDNWRRIRHHVTPSFTTRRIKEMFGIMKQHSCTLTAYLRSKVRNDEAIDVKSIFGGYVLDVMAGCALGLDLDSINNPSAPFRTHASNFLNISIPFFIFQGCFPVFVPLFELLGFSIFSKSSADYLRAILEKARQERKRSSHQEALLRKENSDLHSVESISCTPWSRLWFIWTQTSDINDLEVDRMFRVSHLHGVGAPFSPRLKPTHNKGFLGLKAVRDWLQDMMDSQTAGGSRRGKTSEGLSDHEITSQLIVFVFAGFETSALTFTFLAYNLARNPEAMRRLQEEIDSTFPDRASPPAAAAGANGQGNGGAERHHHPEGHGGDGPGLRPAPRPPPVGGAGGVQARKIQCGEQAAHPAVLVPAVWGRAQELRGDEVGPGDDQTGLGGDFAELQLHGVRGDADPPANGPTKPRSTPETRETEGGCTLLICKTNVCKDYLEKPCSLPILRGWRKRRRTLLGTFAVSARQLLTTSRSPDKSRNLN